MEQDDHVFAGYITEITLRNVRGFKKLELNLQEDDDIRMKSVIIGRNGTGKSTLLRSLALALSPYSEATSLLSASQGSFIREGEKEAEITIGGVDLSYKPAFKIVVTIEARSRHFFLTREVVQGPEDLNLFVCGYGAGRSLSGVTSEDEYRQMDSVGTLFDYNKRLLNAEITLRRLYDYEGEDIFQPAMQGIKRLLELRPEHEIEFRKGGGVQISGPGFSRPIPLDAWADGYRLTFNWIMDLYGRAMQAETIADMGGIHGILLIDEIEQHLHPSMQSGLLNQLAEVFPRLQIFATTHSPLTALGAGGENVISLQHGPGRQVRRVEVPSLQGYSVEDALVEEQLFGTDPYPQSTQDNLERYRELARKGPEEMGESEANELRQLQRTLSVSKGTQGEEDPVDKKLDEVLRLLKERKE